MKWWLITKAWREGDKPINKLMEKPLFMKHVHHTNINQFLNTYIETDNIGEHPSKKNIFLNLQMETKMRARETQWESWHLFVRPNDQGQSGTCSNNTAWSNTRIWNRRKTWTNQRMKLRSQSIRSSPRPSSNPAASSLGFLSIAKKNGAKSSAMKPRWPEKISNPRMWSPAKSSETHSCSLSTRRASRPPPFDYPPPLTVHAPCSASYHPPSRGSWCFWVYPTSKDNLIHICEEKAKYNS